ncbi:hypothetical protein [Sulfurospirillum diekertiae]|uniref:Uncharacterized protein n=1 Tax=Sulfurospirillum diekertiae TaxID=1854492 RepID=A0A1Y0HQE9_9BACT|nr:hypothetical protein [Sulfurospirillum diekertiae]ARU49413.1 hypothetical protein Sdiek1_2261 [Sulfurospirillum diekertiae]ASC94220.1 hypothetical protein Sdiek2_2212 [Sulfurospirillum diekertiae]
MKRLFIFFYRLLSVHKLRSLERRIVELEAINDHAVWCNDPNFFIMVSSNHMEYLNVLRKEFHMACNDEVVHFLIYKQYVFSMADKEKLASQIEANEN